MLIHKDALVVHEATTAADTRYFLNGAFVDKEGRAVATDGHVLVRFTTASYEEFQDIDGIDDPKVGEDVILNREDLVAALATLDKGRNASPYLAIVPNGKHVTIATASKSGRTVQIKSRKVEGVFPAYERVLTVDKPEVARVIFDPKLLEVVARMAVKIGARNIELVFRGKSDVTDQVVFEAKGVNGTLDGAIMPMRA